VAPGTPPGSGCGAIASLSIPWGFSKGDEDLGGYHLVWPRDLVETAGGLLAAGARADARRVLNYLLATQEADGHWPQNMWLDGTPYWSGIQMDETAFPVLLVDLARRVEALGGELSRFWPMVRRAAGYLVRNGPVTQQDRWEEDPGYSPFTLAVEIAGLLVAADFADLSGERQVAAYLRGSVAPGRSWPARGRTTNWQRAAATRRSGSPARSAPSPTKAASCPSRSGMHPTVGCSALRMGGQLRPRGRHDVPDREPELLLKRRYRGADSDALAERASGGLHLLDQVVLGMAGRIAAELAEWC
jgi:hypothetical protein